MRKLAPLLFLLVLSCAQNGPANPEAELLGPRPGVTGAPQGTPAAPQSAAVPTPAGDCRQKAILQLKALDPDGFSIYESIDNKDFFRRWISCDNVQLGLSTAVHESVHYITATRDAFPLVDGGEIRKPHEASKFYAPAVIARQLGPSHFADIYLTSGKASSATDFLYLLDELNAYSHDLKAAVSLDSLRPPDELVSHRDGLAALMAFVAVYVETAEKSEPATWSGLQQPPVANTVATLWKRAEQVMVSSCRIPGIGTDDKTYIRRFCEAGPQSAMQKILGRPPVCPVDCLKTPRTASRN
jgi:hypothetical protein